MAAYLVRRLLAMIPTLVLITVVTFAIMKIAPGDPFSKFIDPTIDRAQLDALRAKWGLNDPIPVQYLRWAGNFFSGDFGISLKHQRPVLELIAERLPATMLLAASALLFALVISIPIGVLSAVRPYSRFDNVATGLAFFGLAMPNFWLGLLLIGLFSVKLNWLPSHGMQSIDGGGIGDILLHLIMPTLVLGTASMASYTRYMRSSLLEVIRQDYIRTARAKGLSERAVIYKHALKNAFIPVATLLGLELPSLVSGSLVTEQVFGWPGLGWFTWRAILERDYPVIMGILTMTAVLTLIGNLLADISYALLDPRVRYD